jgi:ubiquinone/menaquinone biosynthesis C-methylase UbiE
MTSSFSNRAQVGFSKSSAYDAHRPTYSSTVVQELLTQCRVAGKKGAKILDLAAGGGKFTELLAAREEEYEILAVEPHAGMREVLASKNLPRVTVLDGSADELGLEDESVDAVIAAQVCRLVTELCARLSYMDSLPTALPPNTASTSCKYWY